MNEEERRKWIRRREDRQGLVIDRRLVWWVKYLAVVITLAIAINWIATGHPL